MATVIDVARLANVSPGIVSRVLNADPSLRIRDDTRQSILHAARKLDYTPSHAARALRRARSGVIGLAVHDASNPVYREIVAGAQAEATRTGYSLLLADVDALATDDQAFRRMVSSGAIDGLLLQRGNAKTDEFVAKAAKEKLRIVLLNDRVQGTTGSVAVDDYAAARLATQHLIDLGHSRIGHLKVDGPRNRSNRRLAGWKDALTAAGLPVDPELVLPAGHVADAGRQAMRRLLNRTEVPTAVFVANVLSAIGAMTACREAGIRMPDEMSIIAMHDVFVAEHLVPRLTVVRLPLFEMGARAVSLVLQSPEDLARSHETITDPPPEIVLRDSTATPAGNAALPHRQTHH